MPEILELALHLAVGQHHEVGVIASDRLDVRRVAGEVGPRRALREARLVVDRDDLLAGTDGEEHLGRGR